MLILSFESSCDETAAAVVEGRESEGRITVRSSLVASQIAIHALYGGVVPEIASRAHTEAISGLCRGALDQAGVTLSDIDAVAVTSEPGLIGALLVGVNFAKSLAFSYNKPLIPVNHIAGHIAANYICHPGLKPPFFALVTSGGHTSLINVKAPTCFETVGRTRDDAIGEAFDKVARVMGIPYPGGAEMDRLAASGNLGAIKFPSAAISGDTLDMSFSGIKTAVINYLHNCEQKGVEIRHEDVAASFTKAITGSVTTRLTQAKAAYGFTKLALAGGVAANSHLQAAVKSFGAETDTEIFIPDKSLCGDNAAMIGAQAFFEAMSGRFSDLSLNASAVCEI